MKSYEGLARMGKVTNEEFEKHLKKLEKDLEHDIQALIKERVK